MRAWASTFQTWPTSRTSWSVTSPTACAPPLVLMTFIARSSAQTVMTSTGALRAWSEAMASYITRYAPTQKSSARSTADTSAKASSRSTFSRHAATHAASASGSWDQLKPGGSLSSSC